MDIAESDLTYVLEKWQHLYQRQGQYPGGHHYWSDYFRTITATYDRLGQAIADPDLAGGLYSGHAWQLAASSGVEHLFGALVQEIQRQIAAIEAAQKQLKALRAYTARPGVPVVYDTNMLNHWRQPEDIDWKELLRAEKLNGPARLVVPLVVIDELDRQKYGNGALATKATTAIRYLERKLAGAPAGEAVGLRPGVTLEVRLDPPGHRLGEADVEILLCAAELNQLLPSAGTRVLTDDTGMRLRAQSMGLTPLRLPAQYRKGGTAVAEVAATEATTATA
ncbi:PIN domain-containing protein [Kitasatospora sp. NPDC085895]|uniref:PIN domain-containing protein n=1 Tax=Kitasatospora sp. NPDC085895 TaxID=3155057 RepID=UPI00344E6D53